MQRHSNPKRPTFIPLFTSIIFVSCQFNCFGASVLFRIYAELLKWFGLLGINVQSLTQMACDARMMDADARAATVQTIAGHMEDALEIQREVTDVSGLCVSKRWGNYVTCLYVFIKMLYLGNVVLQVSPLLISF
ncbi:hypothetical protein COOONC_00417 [Cooperia oncophora]